MDVSTFEDFEIALRNCVRGLRVSRGFTQAEFANRVDALSQPTIARFEKGVSPNLTLKTTYQLAQAASVPLSDLVRYAEGEVKGRESKDSWKLISAKVDTLPPNKQKMIARVISEIIRSDR